MRNATTRPMLTSSADGAAQPRITSSSCAGSKRWRSSSARPGVRREIGRRERSGPVARLEERRASAVDDVDRFVQLRLTLVARHAGGAVLARHRRACRCSASIAGCSSDAPRSRSKSSTRMTRATSVALRDQRLRLVGVDHAARPPPRSRQHVDAGVRAADGRRARLSLIAALSLASIGSATIVAASARSMRPTGSSSSSPMNMPAGQPVAGRRRLDQQARDVVAERGPTARRTGGPAETRSGASATR